jgi:hypothetical protein
MWKKAVTLTLSAFVVAAIVAVVLQARGPEPGSTTAASDSASTDGVVAYYLHGDVRCATCRKLEAYSAEAVEASGLALEVVNIDQPANRHFVDDFELTTKALVLAEYRDGEIVRWRNLKLIWDLVGEHDGYVTYVANEIATFVGPPEA